MPGMLAATSFAIGLGAFAVIHIVRLTEAKDGWTLAENTLKGVGAFIGLVVFLAQF